jgi:hypothetical protein
MTAAQTTFSLPLPPGTGQGTGDMLIAAVCTGTTDAAGSPGITIVTSDDWTLLGSVGPISISAAPGEGYFMRVYALVNGNPSGPTLDFTSDPDPTVWSGGCIRLTGFSSPGSTSISTMNTGADTSPSTVTVESIAVPAAPAILVFIIGGNYSDPLPAPAGMTQYTNCLSGNHSPTSNLSFHVQTIDAVGSSGTRASATLFRSSAMTLAILPDTCLDGSVQMIATDYIVGTQ